MNNVITTVIGMLLAGSTATMTVSYAGDALQSGLSRATAAGSITTAVQVVSAIQLYDIQEGHRYVGPTLQGLVDSGYLRAIPPTPTRAGDPIVVERDGERMVEVPLGSDGRSICRAVDAMRAAGTGCIAVDGGDSAVFVRV